MATKFRIIDGYNLLHAAGFAQADYAQGELARQRSRLLSFVAACLTTEERQRCTVVFDAIEAPTGLDRQFEHDGIAVLFAEPGHEADDLIEELIAKHSSARQLEVVSSDHRLQKAARIRRATALDSEAFVDQAYRRSANAASSKSIAQHRASHSEPSSAAKPMTKLDTDVSFWLREFGPVDLKKLARDDKHPLAPPVDPLQSELDELQRLIDEGGDLDGWLDEPPARKR